MNFSIDFPEIVCCILFFFFFSIFNIMCLYLSIREEYDSVTHLLFEEYMKNLFPSFLNIS